MSRSFRRLIWLGFLLAGVGLTAAGADWWHRSTRPEARLRRGQEALRRGNLLEAERITARLEAAGALDHARFLRGELLFQQGHYARAVDELRGIQDQGELRLESAALYGQWFLHLKRLGEAEQAFRFVLSEQPDHVDAHRCLAAIYYDQGAWLAAVQHSRQVARLDPEDGRPYRFMGMIYKDLDQPNLAVLCYRDALKRRLADVVAEEVRDELAECLVLQTHYAEALEILEQRAPVATTPKLTALRAECLWGLGRAAEAQPPLEQALREHPRSPDLLRVRAKILLATGETAAAAPLLQRVLEIDPHDFKSRHQLAQAYEALGRRAEAAEQRQRVQHTQDQLQELTRLTQEAKDKPWDAPLRHRLAEVCQQLHRPDLAAMWQRAAAACPPAKPEDAPPKGGE